MPGTVVDFVGQFGALLRQLRTARKRRQVDLATGIGVDPTMISKWEGGVIYPPRGLLVAIRKDLALTDKEFELLYFAWKREFDPADETFVFRGVRAIDLAEFAERSTQFARQLRKSGQPRMAMRLCERDAGHIFDRIRELRWSSMHVVVLGRLAELYLEQCKAGLDYLPRAQIRRGVLGGVIRNLDLIDSACKTEITHFFYALALEGVTYVAGDHNAAFLHSMRLVEESSILPQDWQAEVLRAAAINAGKMRQIAALQDVEGLVATLFDSDKGRLDSGEYAFVMEGIARAWSSCDLDKANRVIGEAWQARRTASSPEGASQLRYVQLVRSEAEICSQDLAGADAQAIAKTLRSAIAITQSNGYDRYADQLSELLRTFE